MKRKRKIKLNPIFTFILGLVIATGTVFAATSIFATDVSFTSKKGLTSTNVQDALDEIYSKIGSNSIEKIYFLNKYYGNLADVLNETNVYGYYAMNNGNSIGYICLNLKNDQNVQTEVCGNTTTPISSNSLTSNFGFGCGGSSEGWGCGGSQNSKTYNVSATTSSGTTTSLTVKETYSGNRKETVTTCTADATTTSCNKSSVQYGKCRRATESELHSDGNGGKYGQVGIEGELNVGDAFLCDINDDGKFNSSNEMFYYKSDYHDLDTDSNDTNYAVLLYYKNLDNDEMFLSSVTEGESKTIKFFSALPSTNDWSLFSLKKEHRLSRRSDEGGNTVGYEGSLSQNNIDENQYYAGYFKYENYAARLLTIQELTHGCTSYINTFSSQCSFLKENANNSGFWLETTHGGLNGLVFDQNDFEVESRQLNYNSGVRPAIEVKKTDMSY